MQNSNLFPLNFEFLSKIQQDSLEDSIYGCMFGQVIGDALGAYLEFRKEIKIEDVEQALKMPGGGYMKLKPGQITDDSEMALCILRGLNNYYQHQDYYSKYTLVERKLEFIALEFQLWCDSHPVDIGITTFNALRINFKQGNLVNELMMEQARIKNFESLSNGSLMRCSSLAVYLALLGDSNQQQMQFFVNKESKITHSNPCVNATTFLWVYTIQQLILNNKIELKKRVEKVLQLLKKKYQQIQDEIQNDKLKQLWEAFEQRQLPNPQYQIGYLGIAWVRGLVLLQDLQEKQISFEDLMKEVLGWGGDTDTNACIIGALFGAVLGFNHFKNGRSLEWVLKTLQCQERKNYESNQVILETQKLIQLINDEKLKSQEKK